MLRLEKDGI